MAKSITSYVAEHRRKHSLLVTLLVGAVLVLTNTSSAVVGFWAVREHEKGHFVLPVRLALRRMWLAVSLGTTISALAVFAVLTYLFVADDPPLDANGEFVNDAARHTILVGFEMYTASTMVFLACTPGVRAAIHSLINRWAMASEAGRARGDAEATEAGRQAQAEAGS